MEGIHGQRRTSSKVGQEECRLPLNPSRGSEGLAPCLKRSAEEVEKEALRTSGESVMHDPCLDACRLKEFESGQELLQAIGSRITDIKSAGCLLAWIVAKAGAFLTGPSWTWLRKILFERGETAVCHEKPRKAVSFPVREGELAALIQRLRGMRLEEVELPGFIEECCEECWLSVSLVALNGLAGYSEPLAPGAWSKMEHGGVENVRMAVRRLLNSPHGPVESFEKVCADVKRARVGYDGEEVGTCEALTLAQVVPALPPHGHGGSIALGSVLSEATCQLLNHPEELLREDFARPIPPIPGKAHFGKGEKERVCKELVDRGICTWVKADEVLVYKGFRILNGIFGVRKPACLEDGRPVLRVIMNLRASNAVLKQLKGSVNSLPAITCFQSATLDDREGFHFYQSDMCSAFYLFRLPVVWHKFLCFNVSAKGEEIGGEVGQQYFLSCSVLPMGWHCSVGLMQEISERILWSAGLPTEQQLRRGFAVPTILTHCARQSLKTDRSFWQVYLDNFMGGEKRVSQGSSDIGDKLHATAEAAWANVGIISSEKKRVSNCMAVEELGALIDGDLGFLGGSPKRFCKLLQATLGVLSQKILSRKEAQVIAGRWVHVLQFRRPGMGFLDNVWKFINSTSDGSGLALKTKFEFFNVMFAIPPLHTSLTAEVHDSFWCSDASEQGGAVAYAVELSSVGKDFLMSARLGARSLGTTPILVVALFSGIGGTFRIYDLLDLIPQGAIAVDIHKPANRIVSRRWPGVRILRDIKDISQKDVEEWALDFCSVREVHLWGGFPCRDLSSARAFRKNLAGDSSGLFFEFLRVWELLETHFPDAAIKVAAENVASMDEHASQEISQWMRVQPYWLDSIDAVPMRRPRLCWTNVTVDNCMDGISREAERRWTKITATARYPHTEQWLEPGWSWPGESICEGFPTCMRAVPKDSPPAYPAGLRRADHDCRSRWAAAEYIFPPYQFRSEFLVWRGSSWRLINSEERGLLMGYGFGHCELAWAASKIKENKKGFELEKCSLIGDAFSVHSFIVIGVALCQAWLPRVHYHHLAARMGMAPGFRAPFRFQAPIMRELQYGCQSVAEAQAGLTVGELNKFFLGRANFTGSDIRVVSGDVLNPRCFPRQPVCARWWEWQLCFKMKWNTRSHINVLELKAILLSIQRGIERGKWSNCRIFHATDSYVAMSVISKGRTSSVMLNRLLKKLNAMLLFHGIQLLVTHVESSENPTDAASRAW